MVVVFVGVVVHSVYAGAGFSESYVGEFLEINSLCPGPGQSVFVQYPVPRQSRREWSAEVVRYLLGREDAELSQLAEKAPERSRPSSTAVTKRRRSLRIADTAVVIGLIASYATSGGSPEVHATVSLVFTAAVGWHFWLHRKWWKSVAKRLSKKRSLRSRGSSLVTVVIAFDLTAAIAFGILAWLGPRSLSGVHAGLANIMVAIALIHVAFNARQLKALIRRRSIVIEPRFRGAADSAHRGYAAGKAASHAEGTVKVELRQRVPLGQNLQVEIDPEEHVTVFDGSNLVIDASPDAVLSIEIPASDDVIDEIFARGPVPAGRDNQHPHCFGCSLEREDGLGIATRSVGSTGIWGTTWAPDESLPSTDGFVDDEVLWAALDCPGNFAASDPAGRPPEVSGSPSLEAMTVQIQEKVRVGEQLAVMGWTLEYGDSTVDCGTAIVDRAHRVKAYAHLCHTIDDDHPPHGH